MLDVRWYLAQRLSALFMVPMVAIHLGLMVYAIQGGLSTEEILGRTRGSLFWFMFYGSFVLAVSVHGAIGFRVVVSETFGLKGKGMLALTLVTGGLLSLLGAQAVYAVTFS